MVYHDDDKCKDFRKLDICPYYEDKWTEKFKQTNGFKNKTGDKPPNQK